MRPSICKLSFRSFDRSYYVQVDYRTGIKIFDHEDPDKRQLVVQYAWIEVEAIQVNTTWKAFNVRLVGDPKQVSFQVHMFGLGDFNAALREFRWSMVHME